MKKDQYTVWKTKYTDGGGGRRDKDNLKLLFFFKKIGMVLEVFKHFSILIITEAGN